MQKMRGEKLSRDACCALPHYEASSPARAVARRAAMPLRGRPLAVPQPPVVGRVERSHPPFLPTCACRQQARGWPCSGAWIVPATRHSRPSCAVVLEAVAMPLYWGAEARWRGTLASEKEIELRDPSPLCEAILRGGVASLPWPLTWRLRLPRPLPYRTYQARS